MVRQLDFIAHQLKKSVTVTANASTVQDDAVDHSVPAAPVFDRCVIDSNPADITVQRDTNTCVYRSTAGSSAVNQLDARRPHHSHSPKVSSPLALTTISGVHVPSSASGIVLPFGTYTCFLAC